MVTNNVTVIRSGRRSNWDRLAHEIPDLDNVRERIQRPTIIELNNEIIKLKEMVRILLEDNKSLIESYRAMKKFTDYAKEQLFGESQTPKENRTSN